jgi:hypothetical protein
VKLYIATLDALTIGERLAQCAHAVAEIHATQPAACAAWREASNTVVVLTMPAEKLRRLAEC